MDDDAFVIPGYRSYEGRKAVIHVLAMGDVGGTLTLAMRLCGGDIVRRIGICDIDPNMASRWEQELNQIRFPSDPCRFPEVRVLPPDRLFDCDVFVFCASRGVPALEEKTADVRMVQLEKNVTLVRAYAAQAKKAGFEGEFFIVSDPVDPLCSAVLMEGIGPRQVQGFGLGVMNGRAVYHAERDPEFSSYLTDGRVFGPHGEDLVAANSITEYDEERSLRLTELTKEANLKIREIGFKPYIAPAVTSGALSILENLRGHWQYSSAWFGADRPGETPGNDREGAFLGMRNRRIAEGLLVEDLPLDEKLFARIERAYRNLESVDRRLRGEGMKHG